MTEAYGLTDTGCIRSNNEDCYRIAPELGLYLLADGMGGAKAGEKASELAVETVAAVFRESGQRNSQVLLKAIETANRRVIELARNDSKLEGMGTTLVAALDMGDELLIASVGDSRAYLLENGSFRPITEDQSWVNEVGRPLGLDEATLRAHPMRNVLTMAIGASPNLIVNCYPIALESGIGGAALERRAARSGSRRMSSNRLCAAAKACSRRCAGSASMRRGRRGRRTM